MSYILDALRRAEAERGRGAVPGIHTPAMPASGVPAERPAPANLVLVGTAVVAVAALAAGGTWWAMQRPAVTPASTPAVAVVPPLAPVQPPPPVQAPMVPMVPPVAVAPSPAATVAPTPAPAPVPTQPLVASTVDPRPVAPKRVAEPVRERPARETEPVRRDAPPPATAPSPAAATAPAAPANGPVFAQNELPPSVREQLPVLQVTGATYSSNPAHRMAIVNGQVLQEGDQAAPGLKLERIEQGRTVWSFRGYRYAVAPQ